MDKEQFQELIPRVLDWGPSPFALDKDEPIPFFFFNEMSTLAGTAEYDGFGKPTEVFFFLTSFRLILYEWRKNRTDRCRSYWHRLSFGDWHWKDADGFLICGIETSPIKLVDPESLQSHPLARWRTDFVSPDGKKKLLEEVELKLMNYQFHNEQRFAPWHEKISVPGILVNEKPHYMAGILYMNKIIKGTTMPGSLSLDDLWLLHKDPFRANQAAVGEIPLDSPLHPEHATRSRKSDGISRYSDSGGKVQEVQKISEPATRIAGSEHPRTEDQDLPDDELIIDRIAETRIIERSPVQKCSSCGKALPDGVLFCGNCGLRVSQPSDSEAEPAPDGEDTGEKVSPEDQPANGASQEKQNDSPGNPPRVEEPVLKKGCCPGCGRKVQPGWKFCPDCAYQMPPRCSSCDEWVQRGWKYCPYCNEALN